MVTVLKTVNIPKATGADWDVPISDQQIAS
jgi:hypothetical protein